MNMQAIIEFVDGSFITVDFSVASEKDLVTVEVEPERLADWWQFNNVYIFPGTARGIAYRPI